MQCCDNRELRTHAEKGPIRIIRRNKCRGDNRYVYERRNKKKKNMLHIVNASIKVISFFISHIPTSYSYIFEV